MGETMDRAGSYWAQVTERAAQWQRQYRYEMECRAVHAWALDAMGGK